MQLKNLKVQSSEHGVRVVDLTWTTAGIYTGRFGTVYSHHGDDEPTERVIFETDEEFEAFIQLHGWSPDGDPLSIRDFAEVWEHEGRWILGPGLLAGYVIWLKSRALTFRFSAGGHGLVGVPLAPIGEGATIRDLVPEELRVIFDRCLDQVLATRLGDVDQLQQQFMGMRADNLLAEQGCYVLENLERRRRAAAHGELWKVVATAFGLRWQSLPPVTAPTFVDVPGG